MDINLPAQFQLFSDQLPPKIHLVDLKRLNKIVRRKVSGQRAAQAFDHFINLRLVRHFALVSSPSHPQVDNLPFFGLPFPGSSKYPRKWAGGVALTEMAIRNLMQDEGLKPRIHFIKGDVFPAIHPSTPQVIWIVSGAMTIQFQNDWESLILEPGDRLDLPAGTPYYMNTGSEGVVYLQARGHTV